MKPIGSLFQTIAANEPHRIKRPSVLILTESVDGNDSRMFESSGNLRFHEEPRSAIGVIGLLCLNLFERDFAMQFCVFGHENFTQTTPCMRPQHAKSQTFSRWCSRR